MFKNALISVSDKTGLIEFVKPLYEGGMKILSTGGTAKFLRENGCQVTDVSELTGFPEVMDGRVKTLHPNVHMGLLARDWVLEDLELLKKYGVPAVDLMICNLYPFEESFKAKLSDKDMIEKIDIGGPSMLRSAAKNFSRICVICDPNDYSWIASKKDLNHEERRGLAAKVFAHTSVYDSLVYKYLDAKAPSEYSLGGKLVMELRYGENSQQQAKWFASVGSVNGLHKGKILQGKALSYNNILDLDAAVKLNCMFDEPACVAVKHNNPCGVAVAVTLSEAVQKTLQSDPVSVFGGIIAVNKTLDEDSAKLLVQVFLECIIAPDFSPGALKVFEQKKNLRLIANDQTFESQELDCKTVMGGFLLQTLDREYGKMKDWDFQGTTLPVKVIDDILFGEKVCGALKSNAIAIVKNQQTLGLGMGQVNRVDAVSQAIERWKKHHADIQDVVLVSDAFFPFPDSVEVAAKHGVKFILQPGGSLKDVEVLQAAKSLDVTMILSKFRHFRH